MNSKSFKNKTFVLNRICVEIRKPLKECLQYVGNESLAPVLNSLGGGGPALLLTLVVLAAVTTLEAAVVVGVDAVVAFGAAPGDE